MNTHGAKYGQGYVQKEIQEFNLKHASQIAHAGNNERKNDDEIHAQLESFFKKMDRFDSAKNQAECGDGENDRHHLG